ncbi:MAG: hypothetical protein EP338_00200 [Bacteroidetes bacterium]|nr:MAG: hypothetical protein EP338_00200 [Bacteroidota bacterium]
MPNQFKQIVLVPFVFICLLLMNSALFAQDTESSLKSKAEKAYKQESFVEASKLYSQLLAFNARDPFYNYRYGVCLIYNSRNKETAIKHLTYASKQEGFDPEAFYYLGRAYHLNYEFAEAIKYYQLYMQKVGGKPNADLDVDRQIEMSQNGKRLLSAMNNMVVLEKKEIETGSFFRIYDLKDIGGDVIVNAQFQSKTDKKKNHVPLIHFPANPNMIFYSSYGEKGKGGKDIYIRRKLPDGTWSLPQTVNGGVNTPYDEDYPYFHPGGKYLYFCSKGHNSMGGYDIFRSAFNKESNSFGPAENLDFAISSPDNDLFYIVDSLEKYAYFASARQSQDGKMHVYKVMVERVPDQLAVIKAKFESVINPANKQVTVEVFDYSSNAKIGTFNSNKKGYVIMTFPKGGKYEYQISVGGGDPIQKTIVSVPFLREFKPLKQKLIHEQGEQGEQVRIVNLFDEPVEDPVATLREIAKMRSELNPNADQYDLDKLNSKKENKELYASLGMEKLSDAEVQQRIQELADKQQKRVDDAKLLQRRAIDLAAYNTKEIERLQSHLKGLVASADSKEGGEQKDLYREAGQVVNKLNELEEETRKLLPLSDSLGKVSKKLEQESEQIRKLSEEVAQAYKTEDLNKMADLLGQNKELIQRSQKQDADLLKEALIDEIVDIRQELKKGKSEQKEFLDTKLQLKEEILDLEIALEEAKTKAKPDIQKKLDSKREELSMVESELATIQKNIESIMEREAQKQNKLAKLQDVKNSKVPESGLNKDQASKDFAATESPNIRTLKAYVEKQNKDLGVDMASLKPLDEGNEGEVSSNVGGPTYNEEPLSLKEIESDQQSALSELSPDYAKNVENLSNDQELDEEKKIKALQKQDKEAKFLTAKEIARVQSELENNPGDEGLKKKLEELEQIKSILTNNISAREQELMSKFPESNPPKMLTESQLTNRIKPHHIAVMLSIENDDNLTNNERMDKAQTEDQEFIRLLSIEKNKLEEKLQNDSLNPKYKHELDLVNKLLSDTERRIEKRTMGMASFSITEPVDSQEVVDVNKYNQNDPGENKGTDPVNSEGTNNVTENKGQDPSGNQNDPGENKGTDPVNSEGTNNVTENKGQDPSGNQNDPGENKGTDPVNSEGVNNVAENKGQDPTGNQNDPGENKGIVPVNSEGTNNVAENKGQDPSGNQGDQHLKAGDQMKMPSFDEESRTILASYAPDYEKEAKATYENKELSDDQKAERLLKLEDDLQRALTKRKADLKKELEADPKNTEKQAESDQIDLMLNLSENRESESRQLVLSAEKSKIDPAKLLAEVDHSYQKNVKALEGKKDEKSIQKLVKREEKLQETLKSKIAANEKKLTSGDQLALEAENQVLKELLEASESRVAVLDNDKEAPKEQLALRKELLGDKDRIMTELPGELTALKKLDADLEAYERKIANQLVELDEQIQQEPEKQSLKDRKEVLQKEQEAVKQRRYKVGVSIGEIEQELVSNSNPPTDQGNQDAAKLQSLETQEDSLATRLSEPNLSKKEKKTIEKSLVDNKEKQLEIQSAHLDQKEEVIKKLQTQTNASEKNTGVQTRTSVDSLNFAEYNQNQKELSQKEKKLSKTRKPSKKLELLEEIDTLQGQSDAMANEIVYNRRLEQDVKQMNDPALENNPYDLESKEALERRKYKVNVEIGELETELQGVEERIKKAGVKEKVEILKTLKPKARKLELLKEQKVQITEAIQKREAEEKLLKTTKVEPMEVSTEMQQQLAGKENFEEMKKAFDAKEAALESYQTDLAELEEAKKDYSKALKNYAENPGKTEEEQLKLSLQKLKEVRVASLEREREYRQLEQTYADLMKDEQHILPQLESLFITGIKTSIERPLELATRNGHTFDYSFKILESPQSTPASERIPIGQKMPGGLVYRVQVGAFRKPLRSDLFSEFTPVTGETISSGITRYITGYFPSLTTANGARGNIRNLGYRDAFVVAYCDGERIPIAKAKRLEASGECVPDPALKESATNGTESELPVSSERSSERSNNTSETGNQNSGQNDPVENEREVEIPTNSGTSDHTGSTERSTQSSGTEDHQGETHSSAPERSTYNQAPGAVDAMAAEDHQGLFFTVQIGAYSKPVAARHLKNLPEVVSKKLDDGKIRYSSGMYPSIEACVSRKSEAVSRGIKDAFITAYYKGDRISIAEAKRLLSEQGPSILEKK